jgi:hypothetical protein
MFDVNRDRCYDFSNIFSEKFDEKIAFFVKNTANVRKICIITLVLGKTPFFRPKLAKLSENCDHNIDPRVRKMTDWSKRSGQNLYIGNTVNDFTYTKSENKRTDRVDKQT